MKINISDIWKNVDSLKINIGDVWKEVAEVKMNIGDSWKTIFSAEFVPSGSPVGWWPADQITGLEDGDPVGTWPDQSGNENDLTQSVAANKPTYKTNIKNGLPVVRCYSSHWMDSSLSLANAPITIQNVGLVTLLNRDAIASLATNGLEYKRLLWECGYSFRMYVYKGNGVSYGSRNSGAVYVVDTFFINSITISASGAINMYQNGASIRDEVTLGLESTGNFRFSSSSYNQLNGDCGDLIVYDSALSMADREANENGLNSKYAIY